jgi:hypothetical protein
MVKELELSPLDRAREWLRSRKLAYSRTFNPKSVDTRIVLQDLAKFCRAHGFNKKDVMSEKATYIAIGRKEVWDRLAHHLNLTDEQLWALYMENKQ